MKTILLQSDGRHAKSLWFSVKIGGGKFSIQARLGIFFRYFTAGHEKTDSSPATEN